MMAGEVAARGRGLVLLALFAGVFIICLTPVSDGDIFWHLAAGRELVRGKAWLRTDPFTSSAAGRPWIDVHWLFQLGAFALHQVAGLRGLVIAKALAVAAAAVVLADTAGRAAAGDGEAGRGGRARFRGTALCAVALLATLFLVRHTLAIRPGIVTLVMLALFLAALERARQGGSRALMALPLLQVVWANCQGLALFGPGLIAAYWVGARLSSPSADQRHASGGDEGALPRRQLAVAFGLCALAVLVTPYGLKGAALPFQLLRRVTPGADNVFANEVAENLSPWALGRVASGEIAHLWWCLAVLALCLFYSRERLLPSRMLVLAAMGGLALMATRNVPLFYWVAAPLAAATLAGRLEISASRSRLPVPVGRARDRTRRAVAGAALLVGLASPVVLAMVARVGDGDIGSPAPFRFPVASVRHLASIGATGAVFAPDHHGGYLELTAPTLRPYIDTRLVLHTADEYAAYLDAVDNPHSFDALARAMGFQYVVLTTTYPDRYLPLARHLAMAAEWTLIYTDGSEVVFSRGDGARLDLGKRATIDAIMRDVDGRFASNPQIHQAARLNLARLLVALGETAQAHLVLSSAHSRSAAQLRARAHLVAGEKAAAEGLALILVESDPQDIKSLALLARVALSRDDGRAGAAWLRRALRVDPYDPEARALLVALERSSSRSAAH